MIPRLFGRQQSLTSSPTICVIAGDDAAPEVMLPAMEVLRLLVPGISFVEALSGREALERCSVLMPHDH